MSDMTTSNISSATPGNICANLGNPCIVIIIPSVAGACIIITIVTIIVCLNRKRRHLKIPGHLPNPQDIDLQPPRNEDLNRRNPALLDGTRELPALPPNESKRDPDPVATASSSTTSSRARKTVELHSPNYQNVPKKFRYSAGDEPYDEDDDDDDDDDDNEHHDYENNPVERQKCEEEQRKRGNESRNANTIQLGAGLLRPFTNDEKIKTFHPTSHSSKLSSSSGGHKDLSSPAISACHSPRIKGYVNTSQSLENLDKRTVPQPPPLPPNPVIKAPSFERHCSPPKPHVERSTGYINQPV